MTNLTDTSAFDAFRPIRDDLEQRFTASVTTAFDLWSVLNAGRGFRHYSYSDTSDEAKAYRASSSYMTSADGSVVLRTGTAMKLNEERLAKHASQFADDAVLGFVAKLVSKVGDIEMTNLRFHGNGRFEIYGTANGHAVRVEQDVVYKYTRDCRLYCQWPARIYVNGQFTPAAKFNAAVAA